MPGGARRAGERVEVREAHSWRRAMVVDAPGPVAPTARVRTVHPPLSLLFPPPPQQAALLPQLPELPVVPPLQWSDAVSIRLQTLSFDVPHMNLNIMLRCSRV